MTDLTPVSIEIPIATMIGSNIINNPIIEKTLCDYLLEITKQDTHKELSILLDNESVDTIITILETSPALFLDIEKTLISIIKDNTIDTNDMPQIITLIKNICSFVYKIKHNKLNNKKRSEICSEILKLCLHVLLVENKIKLDEDKKKMVDNLIDSCVSLLFYPKTLKSIGCFKSIFHKK